MLVYLDELYRNFDDKSVENLHACYIDFEKAFDRVDHSVLKRKLAAFGVSGKLLHLLMSYILNRNQVTVINECISPALPITSMVSHMVQLSAPYSFLYTSTTYRAAFATQTCTPFRMTPSYLLHAHGSCNTTLKSCLIGAQTTICLSTGTSAAF